MTFAFWGRSSRAFLVSVTPSRTCQPAPIQGPKLPLGFGVGRDCGREPDPAERVSLWWQVTDPIGQSFRIATCTLVLGLA
jgi:hypothetical protein